MPMSHIYKLIFTNSKCYYSLQLLHQQILFIPAKLSCCQAAYNNGSPKHTTSLYHLLYSIRYQQILNQIYCKSLTNAAKTEAISNEISTTVNLQGASLTPTTNTTAISEEEDVFIKVPLVEYTFITEFIFWLRREGSLNVQFANTLT